MKMDDAIVEFGFDCKVRKLSVKTVANYQAILGWISESSTRGKKVAFMVTKMNKKRKRKPKTSFLPSFSQD